MFLRSLSPFIAIVESCKVAGLQCNFWVCGRNPAVWSFKWNLSGRTVTWYYLFVCLFFCFCVVVLFFSIFQNEILEILLNFDCSHFLQRIILLFIIFVLCSVLFFSLYYMALAFILTVQPNILAYLFCVRLLCTIILIIVK